MCAPSRIPLLSRMACTELAGQSPRRAGVGECDSGGEIVSGVRQKTRPVGSQRGQRYWDRICIDGHWNPVSTEVLGVGSHCWLAFLLECFRLQEQDQCDVRKRAVKQEESGLRPDKVESMSTSASAARLVEQMALI